MGAVKSIGEGYYGIVSENVSIDRAVATRVDKAFERAKTIPAEKLIIRPAGTSASRTVAPKTPSRSRGE